MRCFVFQFADRIEIRRYGVGPVGADSAERRILGMDQFLTSPPSRGLKAPGDVVLVGDHEIEILSIE